MKRYNAVVGGVYDNSVMVEEANGDWVWYEDVENLKAINAELLEALERCIVVIDNGRVPSLNIQAAARAVIAKAKGEQP